MLPHLGADGGGHRQLPVAARLDGITRRRLEALRSVLQLRGHEDIVPSGVVRRDEVGGADLGADLVRVDHVVGGREELSKGNIGDLIQRARGQSLHVEGNLIAGAGCVLGIQALGIAAEPRLAPSRLRGADSKGEQANGHKSNLSMTHVDLPDSPNVERLALRSGEEARPSCFAFHIESTVFAFFKLRKFYWFWICAG